MQLLRRRGSLRSADAPASANLKVPSVAVFAEPLSPKRQDQPISGEAICDGLRLFHDADAGLFAWAQSRDMALTLTCYQFSGSYLSLALAVPETVRARVMRSGQAFAVIEASSTRPLTSFVRLNVVADGVKQTLHEAIVIDRSVHAIAFDLDGLPTVGTGISDLWLDTIFAAPEMSEITLRDLSVSYER